MNHDRAFFSRKPGPQDALGEHSHFPPSSVHRYNSRTVAIAITIALTGCAGTVNSSLDTMQAGMGAVDIAFEEGTKIYSQAVSLCKRNEELPACDRLGNPEDVLRKAEAVGHAYDETAEGLDALQTAYNEVAPHFEAAAEIVRDAGLFAR